MQEVKAHLYDKKRELEEKGSFDAGSFAYKDFGTFSEESCDYPEYAIAASKAIISGECEIGIFICGTGIGMAITANKFPGIRAAPCGDCFTAEMTRRHNDANVLTLGARVVGVGLALKIVDSFLSADFEGDRHIRRLDMIKAIELQ